MRIPWLAATVVAVDQLTKYWAVTRLKSAGTISVIPGFFSFSYVENPGAAWGMLAGKQIFLIAFSLFTLGFLCWKRRDLFGPLWCGTVTLSLIAGGVIGNLIDRVRINVVVDFLDFFWGRSHFPAFNVADSAICVGVFLFIVTQWHHDKTKEKLGVRS